MSAVYWRQTDDVLRTRCCRWCCIDSFNVARYSAVH